MKWNKKIIEVGGSQGLILPIELLRYLEINLGDQVVIQDDEGKHGKFVSFWKK